MSIKAEYNGMQIDISVEHGELIAEVREDISEFGADFAVFAIIEHRKVSVPFTNGQEEVTVDVVENYALDFDDLTDLADNEYALETSLGKLLKRLEKEDSF